MPSDRDLIYAYQALQLDYGAAPAEVEEAWKSLSQIYNPQNYLTDGFAYQQATNRLKEINHARDVLKHWFQQSTPTRTPSLPDQTSTPDQAACRQMFLPPQESAEGKVHAAGAQLPAQGARRPSPQKGNFGSRPTRPSWCRGNCGDNTIKHRVIDYIETNSMDPTNAGQTSSVGTALIIGWLFAPMIILAATINILFPSSSGHYPECVVNLVIAIGITISFSSVCWYSKERDLASRRHSQMM